MNPSALICRALPMSAVGVLLLVGIGCSGNGPQSTAVLDPEERLYELSGGVRVEFEGETPQGSITVEILSDDWVEDHPLPSGWEPAGPAISMEGPVPLGSVILDLPLDISDDASQTVYAAFWDNGAWQPAAPVTVGDGYVRVRTDHFSLWAVFIIRNLLASRTVASWVENVQQFAGQLLEAYPGPAELDCDSAPAGWTTTSTQVLIAGACIKAGSSPDQVELTIHNLRKFYMEASATGVQASVAVVEPDGLDLCTLSGHAVLDGRGSSVWKVTALGDTVPSLQIEVKPSNCAGMTQILFNLLDAIPGARGLRALKALGLTDDVVDLLRQIRNLNSWIGAVKALEDGNLLVAADNLYAAVYDEGGAEMIANFLAKVVTDGRLTSEVVSSAFFAFKAERLIGQIVDTVYADVTTGGETFAYISLVGPAPPPPEPPLPPEVSQPPRPAGPGVLVSSGSGAVGDIVRVQIQAVNLSGIGLGAWTIDIGYDSNAISAVGCSALQGGVCNESFSGNSARITGASAGGLPGDTALGSVDFLCQRAGAVTLTINLNVFADATIGDPQDIDVARSAGNVLCR